MAKVRATENKCDDQAGLGRLLRAAGDDLELLHALVVVADRMVERRLSRRRKRERKKSAKHDLTR
jgi:hypothetical protein